MNTPQIRIFRNVGAMCFDLYVHESPEDGQRKIGRIAFEKVEPNTYQPPTAQLNDAQGQRLIDDLWTAGFRPTEVAGGWLAEFPTPHNFAPGLL